MVGKNVHTSGGHVYKYYPPPGHEDHDDQFNQHHEDTHVSLFQPDPSPDPPITSHRVLHSTGGTDNLQDLEAKLSADLGIDGAHLVLKGRLVDGEYFIRCLNQDIDVVNDGYTDAYDDVMNVSSTGTVQCNKLVSFTTDDIRASIVEVEEDVEENTVILDAATEDGTANTLAKRNASGDCTFHVLSAEHVHVVGGAGDTPTLTCTEEQLCDTFPTLK